ncbi:hypothetical protein [Ruegeria atlantica]|uniref:hypothetical protein n=1 Tax=Ruegeria atlantica TaxID=81569 RepID=UPI00147A48F7|nr:hypothetical protein [Ruegeria atlantica]
MRNSLLLATPFLLFGSTNVTAQGQMVEELNQLPMGVTDLSTLADQADAGLDVFSRSSGDIDLSDIAGQLQSGSQVYTAGSSAILVTEGAEPVLLIEQPDGGVQAMYICRILPICTEAPD